MLISTYVFMRYDLPCPEYTSADEYRAASIREKIPKINEGAEGIIYKVSDEVVAKTFKEEPDYYDIVKRRIAQKNALIAGVPAPFSFGYAEYEGKIVTLMELINAKSLLQIFSAEEDCDEYTVRYAQFVRQLHEIRGEMMFIDFDSFSTGKAAYDLGTVYRALLCDAKEEDTGYNAFLKLPVDKCRKIWDVFFREYYKDEKDETVREKVAVERLIGTVLTLARLIRIQAGPELISKWAAELEKLSKEPSP